MRIARRLLALGAATLGALLLIAAPASAAPVPESASASSADSTAASSLPADALVIFWGDGCPNCAAQKVWLDEYVLDHPDLEVVRYEVWNDADNRELFATVGEELDFPATAVPTTVLGERVWIGWNDQVREDMAAAIEGLEAGVAAQPGVFGTAGSGTCTGEDGQCSGTVRAITVPGLGEVSLGERSLLTSTLIIGFVDGVNPCSLWVISVLLAIVLRTRDRRRVIAIGTTFLVVTAAMYGLYMAAFYSAMSVVGAMGWIQAAVALAAAIFGAVSVKDYFAFKKGLSFSIADSSKPGIYRRIREAAAHPTLIAAVGATVVLAVLVSLLETPCTAGFPMMWTGLLHANEVGPAETAWLFVAYMVPFLIDELIVFGVALVTMRASKLQDRHGELLKLFAGVTMLALAAVMVIDPTIMEEPVLALILFAVAFVLAYLVHVVTTQVRRLRFARAELAAIEAEDDAGVGAA